ncbi:MAG: amidohydrolase, partial [Cellvibrionaceae bacterium]|nr:amidohydrolase [Cellvibrionaceae bacterium]
RTSELIADILEQNNIEVHRNIGHTGVVGIINGAQAGPSIALRADMDALPMDETAGKSYCSTIAGQAHTCGHDGHSTMLLAAALYLQQNRPARGRIVLIFQPAEETGEGALKMMEEGLLEKFPFEQIYGCHNMPLLGFGKVGMRVGATLSSYADYNIDIDGQGSHAGSQHNSIDPIQVAARMTVELSSLVGRYVEPKQSATVAVGTINA